MAKTAAGKLDRRIKLQRRIMSRDEMGAPLESFVDITNATTDGTVAAEVRALSGDEAIIGAERVAEALYEFKIRHRTDLRNGDRIVYQEQEFDIQSILPSDSRNENLTIKARCKNL